MEKSRIGFLILGLKGGGAERVVSNLASYYAAKCKTVLITFRRDEGEYLVNNKVIRYVLSEEVENNIRAFSVIHRVSSLRKICKKEQLDVLVAFASDAINYALISTLNIKTKCVISVRNSPDFLYKGKIKKVMVRIFYTIADGAVFQTTDAKKWFSKKLQDKSTIIYNPVHESFYNVQYKPVKNCIVTCGRLMPQKNHKLLLNAFKLVLQEKTDTKLYIYGTGPLKEELITYAKNIGVNENVNFEDRVANVASILSQAWAFVLSSDVEGLPNALMEAMAVGVPSVSTDCPCGGPKMLLGNNERGLLVPVNDEKAMSRAILKILSDTHLHSIFNRNSNKFAQKFVSEEVVSEWDSYIDKVLHKPLMR